MSPLPPRPCDSCPYRRDVPSGVWAEEEYAKLPPFDRGIVPSVFMCHQGDGHLCRGWLGCHGDKITVGLRIGVLSGILTPEQAAEAEGYQSPVPLFASGAEAAAHGAAEIEQPGEDAARLVEKVKRRQDADTYTDYRRQR